MLLRESSEALDQVVDLTGTIGGDVQHGVASGVPHGELLTAYAEAAHDSPESVRLLDEQMLQAVGPGGLVDAAATVAVFNGLVRSADATGIPLDEYVMARTVDERAELGLNEYTGSANSRPDS
ncbi:MAG TPA: hypothetical protein QF905_00795 [Acidimicrobiales bacterium]|jgi:hypothetical protein|nr:hypothetical protein [Acidimicrobiales bacterium]MDP7208338.1 hypothetical protein [Acidimicrobiales bacterium]HJL88851.1 hypothetical protein [Acidimicrobiales bacterium]HJO99766.1 hypothetical protein [Acidimicrobiales bacterium]|tara:strand:+ start:2589 stop:2957 length:369 start_codon:yes stop_codon:yes gene_type:complete